jgi:hypothetical protein
LYKNQLRKTGEMDETIAYPRGTKVGRPPSAMLFPNDAATVRDAVKAATRYYGIRVQDLDKESNWVTTAMRKSTEMSTETAERLFRRVQQPDAALVKAKPAKGMSLREAQAVIERFKEDPEANPLPQDPTLDYILKMFEAARVVNNYARPFPGSTLFVTPGTSQRMAELLVESFVEEIPGRVFSEELRNLLVGHLSFYFRLAERPLRDVQNKALLDNLNVVGQVNRFLVTTQLSESLPQEELYDPVPGVVMGALIAADTQRTAKPNPKPAPPKRKQSKRRRRI